MADTIALSINTFGDLLKYLRQRARLTQDEFGLAVGYSRTHVTRLESNQRLPDPSLVQARFIEALDLQNEPQIAAHLIALCRAAHVSGGNDRALIARPPHNLPTQLTRFIGRERELDELLRLLPDARLLTLTGVGGTGKTRLALQLAERVLDDYRDGVWLVELAIVSDAQQVPRTVAAVLGVHETSGQPLKATLAQDLLDKHLLVILDNCEHVIDVCAQLTETLLRGAPYVQVVATSREALGIAGELTWRVPSLSTPEDDAPLDVHDLQRYEAVRLFADRAALALPSFALTPDNAAAVQQICARLDGIPLALELAAARIRTLSASDIAARLSDRFRLLTGGSRTELPRQQTLQATIDWSYRLLTAPERILLQRLGVFSGGWTLEAAEAVCSGDGIEQNEVLDLLARLVDKSLVLTQDMNEATRYRMLETIRQYAQEKLTNTDDVTEYRNHHLQYFVSLGERSQHQLWDSWHAGQTQMVLRIAHDLDNVLRALDWATDTNQVHEGLFLLHAYYNPLFIYTGQGAVYSRIQKLLARLSEGTRTREKAYALIDLADISLREGKYQQQEKLELALSIGMELQDPYIQEYALSTLITATELRGEYDCARQYMQMRTHLITNITEFDPRAVDIYLACQDAELLLLREDYAAAIPLLKKALDGLPADNRLSTSYIARSLGYAHLHLGAFADAERCFALSVQGNYAMSDKQGVAAGISATAMLALARNNLSRAARLFGAAEAITDALHVSLLPTDLKQTHPYITNLHERMDSNALAMTWAAGRAMTLEQAVAYALEE